MAAPRTCLSEALEADVVGSARCLGVFALEVPEPDPDDEAWSAAFCSFLFQQQSTVGTNTSSLPLPTAGVSEEPQEGAYPV